MMLSTQEKTTLLRTAEEEVKKYLELPLWHLKVRTPYYVNYIERDWIEGMKMAGIEREKIGEVTRRFNGEDVTFGRHRGKGTAEELVEATYFAAENSGFDVSSDWTEDGIADFMRACQLGVDCSGFVFNVLVKAFGSIGKEQEFVSSLDNWLGDGRTVYQAGCFVFGGKASRSINSNELEPLDLIMIKNEKGNYDHIALVLGERSNLKVVQSSFRSSPPGVTVTDIGVEGDKVLFGFKPTIGESWETQLAEGKLEFRRLVVV